MSLVLPQFGAGSPWFPYPGSRPVDVPIYLDPSYHRVQVAGGGNPNNAFGAGALDYGRVCGVRFRVVDRPAHARIRLYGLPWNHAQFQGGRYSGWNDGNGNAWIAQTFTTGGAWLVDHAISLVKHEIWHTLVSIEHGPDHLAGISNAKGHRLKVVYHARQDWLATKGLAGFCHYREYSEINLLQARYAGPIFWREW